MARLTLFWLTCLGILSCVVFSKATWTRDTFAQRQANWQQAVAESRPDHWYQLDATSIKEGAVDSGYSSTKLNGVFAGELILGRPGFVGGAVEFCGQQAAVLLVGKATKKAIHSWDWTLSFLLLNNGAPSQLSEELMRENPEIDEVTTSALKLRQFRTTDSQPFGMGATSYDRAGGDLFFEPNVPLLKHSDGWNLLTFVKTGSLNCLDLYINGIKQGSLVKNNFMIRGPLGSIGSLVSTDEAINATVDDVLAYSRSLSPEEILGLARAVGLYEQQDAVVIEYPYHGPFLSVPNTGPGLSVPAPGVVSIPPTTGLIGTVDIKAIGLTALSVDVEMVIEHVNYITNYLWLDCGFCQFTNSTILLSATAEGRVPAIDYPYPTNGNLTCDQLPPFNNTDFIAEPSKCSKVVGMDEAHATNPAVPLYQNYRDNSLLSHKGQTPVGEWDLWLYDDEVLDQTTLQSFAVIITFLAIPINSPDLCSVQMCLDLPLWGVLPAPTHTYQNDIIRRYGVPGQVIKLELSLTTGETFAMRKNYPEDNIFWMIYEGTSCNSSAVFCMTQSIPNDTSFQAFTAANNNDYFLMVAGTGTIDWSYKSFTIDPETSTLSGPSILTSRKVGRKTRNPFRDVVATLNLVDADGLPLDPWSPGVDGIKEVLRVLDIEVIPPAGVPAPTVNIAIENDTIILTYTPTAPGLYSLQVRIYGTGKLIGIVDTLVLTPSTTPTPTASTTVTPTTSGSPQASQTPTPSSGSHTPTTSGSITPTHSGSITPIPSGSITPTSSGSLTPIPSGSITPTPSGSLAPIPSGSITSTPSGSLTPIPSGSITPTPSGSLTPIPSGSLTPIPSGSLTPIPSGSITPTPSGSLTPIPSGSITPTPSGSLTPTPSISITPSPSPSPGEEDVIINISFEGLGPAMCCPPTYCI